MAKGATLLQLDGGVSRMQFTGKRFAYILLASQTPCAN